MTDEPKKAKTLEEFVDKCQVSDDGLIRRQQGDAVEFFKTPATLLEFAQALAQTTIDFMRPNFRFPYMNGEKFSEVSQKEWEAKARQWMEGK